jgi:hypothetical protein
MADPIILENSVRICWFAAAVLMTQSAFAESSASKLYALLSGRTVTVRSSFGDVVMRLAADGGVSGRILSAPVFSPVASADVGRWWVSSKAVCFKWHEWLDGKERCFAVTSAADGQLRWQDDDGQVGIAEIGRFPP